MVTRGNASIMLQKYLPKFFDLRATEARAVLQTFAALFLIITAHTTLETARDAVFLTKLPASQLNVVYFVLAGLTFLFVWQSARLGALFGRRNALICTLVGAAYGATLLHFLPPTPHVALALYVFSGLVGAVLIPQFWMLAAQLFTVAQGRRLFGPIASGGVFGAVAGAGAAALILEVLPVTSLLLVAAVLFVVTALVLTTVASEAGAPPGSPSLVPAAPGSPSTMSTAAQAEAAAHADPAGPAAGGTRRALFGDNPLLLRIAGLVVLSTAAALVVDYLFKSTVAHVVPAARLGAFFARYYAATNAIALVVQLVIAGRLVRRVGVVGAVGVMPFLLLTGGIGALLASGTFYLVLGLKAVDGSLRHSLNRVSTELLYLPLPSEVRERGKGFVDSVLARVVQATTAAVLYFLAVRDLATPRILAFIVVALCAAWLALAATLRSTYLDLFRRALARGGLDAGADVELDLSSAEAIVESMASPDPNTVIGAMDVLDLHGRTKLIPALVLYHEADAVLVRALGLFGASKRTDWIPLGERLLGHPREVVRIATVRALARHGRVESIRKATDDISSRVQGYAAFHIARGEALADLLEHPLIMVIMRMPGDIGHSSRAGLLAAVSDSPDVRAAPLLLAFAARPEICEDGDTIAQVAGAAAQIADPQFIGIFVERLSQRAGRGAIREALVAIGEPALDALEAALHDPGTPRAVRLHVPRTIACFASQRACDVLLARLTDETSGFVRYKIVRGLEQLASLHTVQVDRGRVEKEARHNLEEYLRLLALRTALASPRPEPEGVEAAQATELLFGLLDDKLLQASERAFRLLKIAHPHEDIHRVYTATLSRNVSARANAGEFLDALLARRDQQPLRELLRVVLDDASDRARVDRGAALVPGLVRERDEAIAALVDDHDDALAALAAYHALSLGGTKLHAAVHRARETRPSLLAVGERFLAALALAQDPSRA